MIRPVRALWSASLCSLLGLAACAEGGVPGNGEGPKAPPRPIALSAYEASIGSLVEVYGENLPTRDDGSVALRFAGTFTDSSGKSNPVDSVLDASPVDHGVVRWTSLGPFTVPFSPTGDETGVFSGRVSVVTRKADGTSSESPETMPVTFEVLPSIVVRELQPTGASCTAPVLRALGGVAYRMRVEAVGFNPKSFTYTLSAPMVVDRPIAVRHIATGRFDTVAALTLPEVPNDLPMYTAVVLVEATDDAGHDYSSSFAINVRRPLEVFYNGNVQIAEIFQPTPVGGCIPGGINGRMVNYSDTDSETRTRDFNSHWDESWLSMHTVSDGTMQTVGSHETNGVGFSTTDGQSFNWSVGVNAELHGSIGIGDALSMGMRQSVNTQWGGTTSHSATANQDRQHGVNASETTTDTTADTMQMGGNRGGSFSWSVSSTDTISRSFGGTVIAGTFGVFYRQTVRLVRRAAIVTYNQCGAGSVVGQIDFTDWAWSPDLALGASCPPLPQSNLPRAACLLPPCNGSAQ